MKEIDRIHEKVSLEKPRGNKTIITVEGIKKPKVKLNIIKNIIIRFLQNDTLEDNSSQWSTLLPEKFIQILNLIDEHDIGNDDFLVFLEIAIYDLKNRNWEWYSSKSTINGFSIVFKNSFYPKSLWLIHSLNIPLSKIYIKDDVFGDYELYTFKDITSYGKLDGIQFD
ncbi:hypothetical protein SAMN04488096_11211 [Mesonia phycicola]|uniref:Uncharacterized protein n=1 Tax=Mesonia phycicola TaxID=579105 RepID=A0A1M6HJ13_9FLAO|nr:hypothetical protein [Mesonia phycicola]SHJ22180.1 hypothetical protein SAMN04488096_11211 [Mesonia phycicola]